MNDLSYSTTFLVDQSPQEVFAAVNKVRDWWSGEIAGNTDKLGDTFTYNVPDVHYSQQTISELIPGTKVVWHVSDANLTFVKDKSEWKGTDIVFEIAKKGDKTELRFTHRGLVPDFECHEACSNAWGLLVGGNLLKLIATGKSQPSPW
jgi:hypothetical protein